jgi:hypothetical protein
MSETMTAAKAKALREPFPSNAIGKLPKPYKADSQKGNCNECGGYHGLPAVHLDYVGHAATTDRLLAVDPAWSWEPLSLDEQGLPALDRKGNLWIRLTVCGVTRIGVGDGKSAKECIGDAIRNAAMRFGVALDLWAKEDLHDIAREQSPPEPEKKAERVKATPPDDPYYDAPAKEPGDRQVSADQLKKMHALFSELGIKEREKRLLYANDVLGLSGDKALTTSNDLTRSQASRVIEALVKDSEQPFPTPPEATS